MINENQCYFRGNQKFRVIYVNLAENLVALINIDKDYAMPFLLKYSDFEESIKYKVFIRANDDTDKEVLLDDILSEKQKQKRNRYFGIISESWIKNPDKLLNKRKRRTFFKEIQKETNLSLSTVERMFTRFWQRGMNRNAVLPDSRFSGGFKREKNITKKSGRKSERIVNGKLVIGKILSDKDKLNIHVTYETHYRHKNGPRISSAYRWMLDKFYNDKFIINDNGEKIRDPEQTPSYRQFCYEIDKYRNKYKDINKRKGPNYYALNCRAHLSGIKWDNLTVCSEVQIDATILNIEVVSSINRQPIGKPILFAATDTFSRMVIGLSLGLVHDSWEGYTSLLINIVSDKVEYCKGLGIEIEKSQWSAEHLPKRILSDNGAFVGKSSAMLLDSYGVELEFAASYRPDMKPIIERLWRTYKDFIRDENIPGAVYEDSGERGGRPDPKKYACLTLEDVEKIIAYVTLQRNNSMLEGITMPIEMAAAGVKPIPVDMFNWGIKEYGEPEKHFDRNTFRVRMLPKGEATVTEEGIQFEDRHYVCDMYNDDHWESNRLGEKFSCKFDPSTINILYIFDYKQSKKNYIIACNLTDKYKGYVHLSKDEWDSYQKGKRNQVKELKEEKEYKRRNLTKNKDKVVNEAKQKRKAFVSTGRKHVRVERKDENKLRKMKKAIVNDSFRNVNFTDSRKIDSSKRNVYDRNALGLFDENE